MNFSKNKILFLVSLIGSVFLSFSLIKKPNFKSVNADEDQAYSVIPINEFSTPESFTGGIKISLQDDSVTLKSGAYCGADYSFAYNGSYGYKTNVSFSNVDSGANTIYFSIADQNIRSSSSISSGYCVVWGSYGTKLTLYKDGVSLKTATTTKAAVNTRYDVEFHIVDVDESNTRLVFKINDNQLIDYVDNSDPLKPVSESGILHNGIWTVWRNAVIYNITTQHDYPVMSLNTMSAAHSFAGSDIKVSDDEVKILSGGFSGVTYEYNQLDSYGYKARIKTPSTTNVIIYFVIGDTTSKAWSSSDKNSLSGYSIKWYSWGSKLDLINNVSGKVIKSISTSVAANTTYDIEFSLFKFDETMSKIVFKVNDKVKISSFVGNFSYTSESGNFYNTVWTQSTALTIINEKLYDDVSISPSELGNPVLFPEDQDIDRNGNITFTSGLISYQTPLNKTLYNFKIKPSQVASGANSYLAFMLNYSGDTDTEKGSGWDIKGYCLILYGNGMREVLKDGERILGPDWYGQKLVKDTEYLIRIGTYVPYRNVTKFVCDINGKNILNFTEEDGIESLGKFTIHSVNCSGLLTVPNYQDILLNGFEEIGLIGDKIHIGYENPQEGDVAEFFVDEELSTATASFTGNELEILSQGDLYIYGCINGIYTKDFLIKCYPLGVMFDGLPSVFVAGSGTLKANILVTTHEEVEEVIYSIVEGSEIAEIDENGVVTPFSVGKIKIQVEIICTNGDHFVTPAESGEIIILPLISITNEKVAVDSSIDLIPTINITNSPGLGFSFELVDGDKIISLENGTITGKKAGIAHVRVTYGEGSEFEISNTFDIESFGVIMHLPANPIIFGNGNGQVTAELSDGAAASDIKYYVENGSGSARIDEQTGEIEYLSAGTVKVYAVIDGKYESKKTTLVINPKIELGNTLAMSVGAERDFSFVSNCPLPEDENIIVTYELLSEIGIDGKSGDVVDFDEQTGHVFAKAIGQFTVRVTVVGETFSGVTSIDGTTIPIENPIVVTMPVEDMYVGETQLIEAVFGNGEIRDIDERIVVTTGADLVQVDGMSILAIHPGTVKFHVEINGVSGLEKEMVINNIDISLVAFDMNTKEAQTLDYVISSPTYQVNSVEYLIVSGEDFAKIEGNTLISGSRPCFIVVKVVVNGILEAVETINIHADFYVPELAEGEKVPVGRTIDLTVRNENNEILEDYSFGLASDIYTLSNVSGGRATLTAISEGNATLNIIKNNEVVDTINFVITEKVLDSLSVKTMPYKTEYELLETFDQTGLEILGVYSDGSTVEIDSFGISGFESNKPGIKHIQVSCGEVVGYFDVRVKIPQLSSLSILSMPNKTTYEIGEEFDKNGLVVQATSTGGITFEPDDYEIVGFDSSKEGQVNVTVSYGNLTTTFTVKIVGKPNAGLIIGASLGGAAVVGAGAGLVVSFARKGRIRHE